MNLQFCNLPHRGGIDATTRPVVDWGVGGGTGPLPTVRKGKCMDEPVVGPDVPNPVGLPPQGIGYLLILYRYNPDGSTGEMVHGPEATAVGERLGLGEPSDGPPTDLGIWYIEP